MLRLKFQYFGHLMQSVDSLERLWCWEGLGAGGEGNDIGWDAWMEIPTRWTWVWLNSGSWWWTRRPGVLQFMGSQRVGHDWATDLHWTEAVVSILWPLRSPGYRQELIYDQRDHECFKSKGRADLFACIWKNSNSRIQGRPNWEGEDNFILAWIGRRAGGQENLLNSALLRMDAKFSTLATNVCYYCALI